MVPDTAQSLDVAELQAGLFPELTPRGFCRIALIGKAGRNLKQLGNTRRQQHGSPQQLDQERRSTDRIIGQHRNRAPVILHLSDDLAAVDAHQHAEQIGHQPSCSESFAMISGGMLRTLRRRGVN